MPSRRHFLHQTALLAAPAWPVVRPAPTQRQFRSPAVEAIIDEFSRNVKDSELAWLFGNCLAYSLDATVRCTETGSQLDTFVATSSHSGVMELRDSTAQVWPYLWLAPREAALRQLIAGVIRRQARCILLDSYANAFYEDPARVGESPPGQAALPPGVHERKWEIDSLTYPLRLAYHYWKITGDHQPFDADWWRSLTRIVATFREQQRKDGPGPYHFQRPSLTALDTQPLGGYGYPARPCGLIASAFGPGGHATRLPFLVPSNFLTVSSLRQAALMLYDIYHEQNGYYELMALADEVATALRQHALVPHPTLGPVYAYEVDGYGGQTLLDEAPAPSLLALPYLDALPRQDPTYQSTRRFSLSAANPFYYQSPTAEGLGSARTGPGRIWPLALALRGLTSPDPAEIRRCVQALKASHAGTGYLPESFHPGAPTTAPPAPFAEANSLAAEFLWKVYKEQPELLA